MGLEENGRGIIGALPRYLSGGTVENRENFIEDTRCSGRDSNRTPPKYESRALQLLHLAGLVASVQ
jgi:hypothetical protein